MSKKTKIIGLVSSVMGGSWLFGCGCAIPSLGFGDFCEGLFTKGIVDNWCIDMITDWLAEDIFG
jgi:hypothetical protein